MTMGRLTLAILGLAAVTTGAHAAVITKSTKLTANLIWTNPDEPAIRIAASGVVLDLGTFAVVGPRNGRGIGIAVDPGVQNVTIRGGTVTGFETAIYLPAETAGHEVRSLVARRNSGVGVHVDGAATVVVAECEARENGVAGIVVTNSRGANIHHNIVQDNDEAGLVIGLGTTGAKVERNVSRFNDGSGIVVEGGATANTIRRNTSAGNADYDLVENNSDCSDNLWFRNLFTTANSNCID
jgi:parallel beta-helix repeat protein